MPKRIADVLLGSLDRLHQDLRNEPAEFRAKYNARTVELDLSPAPYDAQAVINTRRRLSASQSVFAELVGVSVDTVQSWEQDINPPESSARRVMDMMNEYPDLFLKMLRDSSKNREQTVG